MRKAIIGALAGVGLLFGVGCNPPPHATPDRTLGPSEATQNTYPGVVAPERGTTRPAPQPMLGTGGAGAAGTSRAFGPSVPLGETAVGASQVNFANQGMVVGGRGNVADAYSTEEPSQQSVAGAALAPRRARPAPQLQQHHGKKPAAPKKPNAQRQRTR